LKQAGIVLLQVQSPKITVTSGRLTLTEPSSQ